MQPNIIHANNKDFGNDQHNSTSFETSFKGELKGLKYGYVFFDENVPIVAKILHAKFYSRSIF